MKSICLQLTAALAALFIATCESEAKVLIYKGTLRATSDASSAFPKRFELFQVFDPDQSTFASVLILEANGQKLLLPAQPADVRYAQAAVASGKSATVISLVLINGASNDFFENTGIHFRGINKSLRFSSGIAGNIVSFPRQLLGTVFDDEAFNGQGAFIEQRIVLSYQEGRTVTANDGNQSAQQAIDAIVAELKAKGFQVPGV